MSFPIFKTGSVVCNAESDGFSVVGAQNIEYNPGLKEFEAMAAGQITPSFVAIMDARPTFTMTVYDIATLVSNGVGAAPLAFGSGQTITSIDVYGIQFQEDGTIVIDTDNSNAQVGYKFAIAKGVVTLDSISARQGQVASAKITIHCESSDGSTHPVTPTASQDLPAIPVLNQAFTLGQVEVDGTTLTSTQSLDYNANWKVDKVAANGAVLNVDTQISEFKPKLTFSSTDLTLYGTYTGFGTALGSSTFVAYFQAMALDGERVAAGTASHIKLIGGASQGMIWTENVSLSPASSEIRLHICPIVGTNPVLAISVAAIT